MKYVIIFMILISNHLVCFNKFNLIQTEDFSKYKMDTLALDGIAKDVIANNKAFRIYL